MTKFCIVCKKKHQEDSYRWRKAEAGFYCHHGIDCIGCKEIHYNDTGFTRINSQGSICGKWAKSAPPTMEQKMAGLSPEEVMSGVHLGNEMLPYFKGKSSNNYSEDRAKQTKELRDALK